MLHRTRRGADLGVSDGAGGCICTGDVPDAYSAEQEVGTWTAASTSITFNSPDGPTDVEYCVDGDVLRVYDAAASSGIGLIR